MHFTPCTNVIYLIWVCFLVKGRRRSLAQGTVNAATGPVFMEKVCGCFIEISVIVKLHGCVLYHSLTKTLYLKVSKLQNSDI